MYEPTIQLPISFNLYFSLSTEILSPDYTFKSILITKIASAQNEDALSYHIVRVLYFLIVIFAATMYVLFSLAYYSPEYIFILMRASLCYCAALILSRATYSALLFSRISILIKCKNRSILCLSRQNAGGDKL